MRLASFAAVMGAGAFFYMGLLLPGDVRAVPQNPVANSSLRISCEEDSVGAEVHVNGKFRGECPVDLRVLAGQLLVRVSKSADSEHERVFEQTVRMGEDSSKRIDVVLSEPRLTAAAQRAEQARISAEEARQTKLIEKRRRIIEDNLARMHQAAAGGDAAAMLALSEFHAASTGGAPDLTKAHEWLVKAANSGDPRAMGRLGERYENGQQVSADMAQALAWYRKGADAGDPVAQAGLGAMYNNGTGVAVDMVQARTWWEPASAAGNARAMNGMGNLFYYGDGGVTKNHVIALEWYEKAAALGSVRAIGRLAALYGEMGEPGTYQPERAFALAQKGAELGNPSTMTTLGFYYSTGVGTSQNQELAWKWAHKAAELGNGEAMNNIGYYYSTGRGVPKNIQTALSWYRRSAAAGSYSGAKSLAIMVYDGEATPADRNLAILSLRKIKESGYEPAKIMLKRLGAD